MKIKNQQDSQTPTFKPVELTLVIESQDELNGLWALFNNSRILGVLSISSISAENIRKELESVGAQKHSVTWYKLWNMLQ